MLIDINEAERATILAALKECCAVDLRDRIVKSDSENIAIVQAALEDAATFIEALTCDEPPHRIAEQLDQLRLAMNIAGSTPIRAIGPTHREWSVLVVANFCRTRTVTIEADSADEACERALADDNGPGDWVESDDLGRVWINAVAEVTGDVLYAESPVPERFTERR